MKNVTTAAGFLLIVVALSTLSLGCARNPALFAWTQKSKKAERVLERKEYDQALQLFVQLAQSAHSEFDAINAQMRQAETLRRAGKFKKSEQILGALSRSEKVSDREQRAKVAYKLGRVVMDSGSATRAEKLLKHCARMFPNTIFGHRSFTYLRGRLKARSESEFVLYCQQEYQRDPRSDLADNYLYEAARVHEERKQEKDDKIAAVLYQKVISNWRFETSALWDDAVWDLSLIRHRQGRYMDEIHLLKLLISTREFTTWIGSYEIRNYKHAALRIGQVYYTELKNYDKATRTFRRFGKDFSESRLLDDALWWLGHSLLKNGQKDDAEAVFKKLLTQYPESKYAQRVRNGSASP